MEIGCLSRWYDAGPILTANLGDTANPSWNDLILNLQHIDFIRWHTNGGPGTIFFHSKITGEDKSWWCA